MRFLQYPRCLLLVQWLPVLLGLAILLAPRRAKGEFVPSPTPLSPGGVRATADLPRSQHHKNVGGSDGAGLCVYTSGWHAALWQRIDTLYGFRDWMRKRPGGSWPEKWDATIRQYCESQGASVPDYVQHTKGDPAILELALKTGRMPCVTYSGRDDFYRSRVAHMVNLVHLDERSACILDNNRPGVFLWMSRSEFLARWREMGGGWAIVFLAPPPPPYPVAPSGFAAAPVCDCGGGCRCGEDGACQCVQAAPGQLVVGQCGPGGCRVPLAVPQNQSSETPIGPPPSPEHEWGLIPGFGYGWRFRQQAPGPRRQPLEDPDTTEPLTGVVSDKIRSAPAYSVNGIAVTQGDALGRFGDALADDSGRWSLAVVGDAAFVARVKSDLPAEARDKLLVVGYEPTDWPVAQFALAEGVTLRKPAVGRIGAEVGRLSPADYAPGRLLDLLRKPGGPLPALPVVPVLPRLSDLQIPWKLIAIGMVILFVTYPRKSR